MPNNQEQRAKLLELVRAALTQDAELRNKYQVGEKFRFIRDRLQALLTNVEENLKALKQETTKPELSAGPNETIVYVYLYNAQGANFSSWQKLLNPAVFYEYSVNRPIYADQVQVESFIRTKQNKLQHGYLAIIVDKQQVLSETAKDSLDQPLIKVREGALKANRLLNFIHNGNRYGLNEDNEIIKKN